MLEFQEYSNYFSHKYDISVFKFCVIGGIFLYMFADAVLFDMMLNTSFEDGVNTHQDLIDREMSLGIIEIDHN